nr:lytic transglycosylase domain-containing protein [Paracoccus sp. S-4012]
MTRATLLAATLALAACTGKPDPMTMMPRGMAQGDNAGLTPELRALIEHYAAEYDVPVTLVHRVVQRESRYRAEARNGPYMGLMQILPQTAQTMGFRGEPAQLLDAETNLRYGVKYLRGAWLVSGGDEAKAVQWYANGYYYEAKRKGLLKETGLKA